MPIKKKTAGQRPAKTNAMAAKSPKKKSLKSKKKEPTGVAKFYGSGLKYPENKQAKYKKTADIWK